MGKFLKDYKQGRKTDRQIWALQMKVLKMDIKDLPRYVGCVDIGDILQILS